MVFLVLGAVGAWVLWHAFAPPAVGRPFDGVAPGADVVDRSLPTALEDLEGDSEVGAVPSPPENAAGFVQREEVDAEAQKKGGRLLTLIDARTSAPIPGATVRWIDEARVLAVAPSTQSPSLEFRRLSDTYGIALVTDVEGRTRLPVSDTRFRVEARTDELSGSLHLPAGWRSEVRLELRPIEELWVRVVDAAGSPMAGVQVGWYPRGSLRDAPTRLASSDVDGLAVLTRVQTLPTDVTSKVALVHPLLEPVAADVHRHWPRSDPIVLCMPATGSVKVVVTGAAFELKGARLRVVRAGEESRPGDEQPLFAWLERGATTFERIGLGLELEVGVTAFGSGDSAVRAVRVSGPTRAGETVTVPISLADVPILRARLLGTKGEELEDQAVIARVRIEATEGVPERFQPQRTDATGRFLVVLPDPLPEGGRRWLDLEARLDEDTARTCIDLGRSFPPGVTDFGDVRLGSGSVIAEGRVVDEAGAPVARALVQVEYLSRTWGTPPQEQWDREFGIEATTDANGVFRIPGLPREEPRAVRASKSKFVTTPRKRVVPGARGIVLVLAGSGHLEGSVLRTEEQERFELQVDAWLVDGTDDRTSRTSTMIRFGSTFQLHDRVPGRWRVSIEQPGGFRTEALEAVVAAGGTTELEPIDLRSRCRVVTLRVGCECGCVLRGVQVMTAPSRSPEFSRAFTVARPREDGKFEFLADDRGLDVMVTCYGHEIQEMRVVKADQTITLRSKTTKPK